jgi:hypothetical protein
MNLEDTSVAALLLGLAVILSKILDKAIDKITGNGCAENNARLGKAIEAVSHASSTTVEILKSHSQIMHSMAEMIKESSKGVDVLVKQHSATDHAGRPIWWARDIAEDIQKFKENEKHKTRLLDDLEVIMRKNIELLEKMSGAR